MERVSKENYYLDIAEAVIERATCPALMDTPYTSHAAWAISRPISCWV